MARKPHPITRREFMRRSAELAAGAGLVCGTSLQAQAASSPPGRLDKSIVVTTRSEFVASGTEVSGSVLRDMFEGALTTLTDTETAWQAWRELLRGDDTIGIKFDAHGEHELATSVPVASMLVNSLLQAGWTADRIMLADGPRETARQFGVRLAPFGWTAEPVMFGSHSDQLAAFLDQVTALINVPFLKDDNIMGLSGCLKNITYHVLKHPARCHARGGVPYLADLYSLPQIRGRLRLNVVNALRTVYNKGPLVEPQYVHTAGALLLGRDPIAADTVALDLLNEARNRAGLGAIPLTAEAIPSLFDAADKRLGHIDFRQIERLDVPHL